MSGRALDQLVGWLVGWLDDSPFGRLAGAGLGQK